HRDLHSFPTRRSSDLLEALRDILIPVKSFGAANGGMGPGGSQTLMAQVPLSQVAKVRVVAAPMGIKSEAAIPNAWVYVDVQGSDIGTYVRNAQRTIGDAIQRGEIKLPTGYTVFWS